MRHTSQVAIVILCIRLLVGCAAEAKHAASHTPKRIQTVTLASSIADGLLHLKFTNHTDHAFRFYTFVATDEKHFDYTEVTVVDPKMQAYKFVLLDNRDGSIPAAASL